MKFCKKLCCMAAALALTLSLIPGTAQAAESAWDAANVTETEWEVLRRTNRERYQEGVDPLTAFSTLQEGAHIRAEELQEFFSHDRPDGSSCFSVLEEVGLANHLTAGENIASGYQTPADVVEGWMNSESGHRENILREDYLHVGVGAAGTGYRKTWEQLFYTSFTCSYTNMELVLPEQMAFPAGTTIDEMNLAAKVTCRAHGDTYLPILSEYCTGYDPYFTGAQTVIVSCLGMTASFQVRLNPFVDVPADAYYFEPVLWAVENGITYGVSSDRFAPNETCTRCQVVSFLWRTAGEPEPDSLSSFSDVPKDTYYAKAVAWAVESGITYGVSSDRFAPHEPCTRAQVAAFLWRAAGEPEPESTESFPDVPKDAYYAKAVAWAVENGITYGVDANRFAPNDPCTRAQIVSFLYRTYADY